MAPNKLVSALGIGWVRGGRIKRRVWVRGSSFPHLQASFWAELELELGGEKKGWETDGVARSGSAAFGRVAT
jgi:hypothetical protein